MGNVVEPIKNKDYLSEIEKNLERKSKRNQLIWAFGLNTGLRISDILGLNISDVYNKQYVEIKEKKTGKYKRFPLNDKLKELITIYLSERSQKLDLRPDEPLFLSRRKYRLDRCQAYRIITDACNNLGIKSNVGTHTMRKTFGYFFYQKFNNVALLQKILNHSSPSITLRYIGISQEEIDISYKNFEL